MSAAAERELLATTAALLGQGQRVDQLSRAMTVTALVGLLTIGLAGIGSLLSAALLILSIIAGGVELYLGIRVGFDAALFQRLASATGAPDFANLDAALGTLGLAPAGKAGRSPQQRTAGACRLLRLQGVLAAAQLVVLIAAVLTVVIS